MFYMLTVASISLILSSIVVMIFMFTSTRSSCDREKMSPFECGFDPNHMARIPFSMRFFLLAIIFIVFDIEIVLLMPIPIIYMLNSTHILFATTIFLIILFLGLIHEWNQGSLSWTH